MTYEELGPVSHAELTRLLADGNAAVADVVRALLAMSLHETDRAWAEGAVYQGLGDGRLAVQRAAAKALGHLRQQQDWWT